MIIQGVRTQRPAPSGSAHEKWVYMQLATKFAI